TALGEATVSLELLVQIHETAGVGISPSLVPNSVHNSPAGYLTIGLGNRQPSATVSEGWLSAPAALVAAQDYLVAGLADQVLVVVGDEADPAWIDRLESCGASDLAGALAAEQLQESVVALVVGLRPCGRDRGTLRCAVIATESVSSCFCATLASWGVELRQGDALYLQGDPSGLLELEAVAVKAGALPGRLGAGLGTCGGQALALLAADSKVRENDFVYAGVECRELGVLHFCPARSK
ncbi:MAG: beta-ketoacyl synthase chain length factor, partial [Myxococcota bacterium]|nr:beta-ketoacyl synthase chain length factor [Myxococcota bacterium]